MDKDSKTLFDGLKIMEHKDIVEEHLNKYPVIFLTLKSVEDDTYENAIGRIRKLISELFQQYQYVYESGRRYAQQ